MPSIRSDPAATAGDGDALARIAEGEARVGDAETEALAVAEPRAFAEVLAVAEVPAVAEALAVAGPGDAEPADAVRLAPELDPAAADAPALATGSASRAGRAE